MKNVLIADDHEIVRKGIRMLIEGFPQKYHYIEASTCKEVVDILANQEVDFAILDMFLADGSIFSAIQQIAQFSQRTTILVYSMNAEHIYAKRFIEKGVRGFVCKQSSIGELEKAIQVVFNGEIYLSPELKEALFNPARASLPQNPIDSLSDRELEVVEYMVMGMGTKEIAHIMKLDTTTVSTYRRRAFEKLDAQNTIELKDKFLLYKEQP